MGDQTASIGDAYFDYSSEWAEGPAGPTDHMTEEEKRDYEHEQEIQEMAYWDDMARMATQKEAITGALLDFLSMIPSSLLAHEDRVFINDKLYEQHANEMKNQTTYPSFTFWYLGDEEIKRAISLLEENTELLSMFRNKEQHILHDHLYEGDIL